MRRVLLAALLAGLAIPAQADTINVALDEVQTITFPRPIAKVYAGNPAIADITPIDTRRAFILGKSYGTTNIIALDKDGTPISNTQVTVLSRQQAGVNAPGRTVVVQRGAQRTTYNCIGNNCEAVPQIGDGAAFAATGAQVSAHQDAATKAAAGSAQSD